MIKKNKFSLQIVIFLFFIAFLSFAKAQVIPEHISNQGIYLFLDELASQKIIEINSLIKPYSRELIAEKLMQAKDKKEKLNKRQQTELEHYLQDYNLELNRPAEF